MPNKKLIIFAYIAASFLNSGKLIRVSSWNDLLSYLFIDNLIITVIIVIIMAVVGWIIKKN